MPTLSVIIPNYNRAELIGETLDNVLAQSRAPDEVIVVDDGSTDASCEVIASYGKSVRLIRQANAGPGPARNRGLREATGELIQFMDSDDLWTLNKLAAQERALLESGADFAYSPWLQARLEGGVASYAQPPIQQRPLPASRTPLAWFLRGWVIVFQCCLFRRALLDAVGPYREDLMPSEDSELLFRILRSGARPVHVPEAMVLYRLHGGAQISRGGMANAKRARDWEHFTSVVADQLEGTPGIAADDIERWRWTQAEAAEMMAQAGQAARPLAALSGASQARHKLDRLAHRVAMGFSRRRDGNSLARAYGAGPLSASQEAALAAIGYATRRVVHAELDGA